MTLRELAQTLSDYFNDNHLAEQQATLFQNSNERSAPMTAATADAAFMRGNFDTIPLRNAVGRIAVEGALPYPPGIFVVVPGEAWTQAAVDYFDTLYGAVAQFPASRQRFRASRWPLMAHPWFTSFGISGTVLSASIKKVPTDSILSRNFFLMLFSA